VCYLHILSTVFNEVSWDIPQSLKVNVRIEPKNWPRRVLSNSYILTIFLSPSLISRSITLCS
jgi:hypothetical protein